MNYYNISYCGQLWHGQPNISRNNYTFCDRTIIIPGTSEKDAILNFKNKVCSKSDFTVNSIISVQETSEQRYRNQEEAPEKWRKEQERIKEWNELAGIKGL